MLLDSIKEIQAAIHLFPTYCSWCSCGIPVFPFHSKMYSNSLGNVLGPLQPLLLVLAKSPHSNKLTPQKTATFPTAPSGKQWVRTDRELHAVCTVKLLHSIAFISCFVVHTCFSTSSFNGSVSFPSQFFSLSCSHLKGEAAFVSSTQHSVRQDHMVRAFPTGITWPGHNAALCPQQTLQWCKVPPLEAHTRTQKDAKIQPPPNRPPDATNYSSMRINWPELSVKTRHLTDKNPLLFLLDSVL